MGRIVSAIPGLYHGKDNDLIRFVDALDVEVKGLERQVRGITDLINIDKCPDDKLPYLAALTNCPLIGNDPVFWRRQIKNWPYILKLKGTQRSLELVLDTIGAASWDIKTFFRDAGGGYVTDKPKGKPFLDHNGLWHNIRTHYFGIEFTLSKDFVLRHNFDWDVDDVKEKLRFWFEHGKPYHAELLNLIILPPKFLPDDHICKWDICNWEHAFFNEFRFFLIPNNPIFEAEPVTEREFERGILTISDSSFWDFSTWGCSPYRLLNIGRSFETVFFAALDDDYLTWLSPYDWQNFTWSDSGRLRATIGTEYERIFPVMINLNAPQFVGSESFRGIICDTRPYWDIRAWFEHATWSEEPEQLPIASCIETPLDVSLDWGDYPPIPTWSSHKTWAGSDTWIHSNQLTGTGEFSSLIFEEV